MIKEFKKKDWLWLLGAFLLFCLGLLVYCWRKVSDKYTDEQFLKFFEIVKLKYLDEFHKVNNHIYNDLPPGRAVTEGRRHGDANRYENYKKYGHF